jgi:hypothetical protein
MSIYDRDYYRERSPKKYQRRGTGKHNFSLAGFAAILSAAVLVPLFIFQIYADITGAGVLSKIITLISVALYTYVFLSLKALLHNHEQYDADTVIGLSIGVNIVGSILQVVLPQSGAGTLIAMLFLIGIGILYILLGIKILNTRSNLHGLKNALGITTIVTGVGLASVLLMMVAMVSAMAMDVMLGILFFKEGSTSETRARIDPSFRPGEGDWSDVGRRKRVQSSTTIFLSVFGSLVIGGLIIWFARVAYAQWAMKSLQQQTLANIQQIQANALAQQRRIQREQRERIEAERRWKQEHPTMRFAGYQKVWVPGKPLDQCKRPGQTMDNATVACINGYYENRPVYTKE